EAYPAGSCLSSLLEMGHDVNLIRQCLSNKKILFMHIETLKVFCDVVETRSFSTAASQNFVTQSAVSQQIRALETKYDCKLIERTRGAVQVTPAGEVVYQASKESVQRYLDMESGLQSLNNRVGGTLRIATVYSVGLYEPS